MSKITKLKAFGPSVVIEPYKFKDRKTKGGIHIPDNASTASTGDMPMGLVLDVGDVPGISINDEIIYSGRGFQIHDLRVVPADQILAIVEEYDDPISVNAEASTLLENETLSPLDE